MILIPLKMDMRLNNLTAYIFWTFKNEKLFIIPSGREISS
jgi:hypothetical protein